MKRLIDRVSSTAHRRVAAAQFHLWFDRFVKLAFGVRLSLVYALCTISKIY
jgi:hypothetical protein